MRQDTASEVETIVKDEVMLSLEGLIRVGARRMLEAALEFEVEAYIENLHDEKVERGHRQVVRNGSHKPRNLITGVGRLETRQPRKPVKLTSLKPLSPFPIPDSPKMRLN